MFKQRSFSKAVLLSVVLAASVAAQADPRRDYGSELYSKDVAVLVPFAVHLEGQCNASRQGGGAKSDACQYSESILRVLRELAMAQHVVSRISGEPEEASAESVKILMEALVAGYGGSMDGGSHLSSTGAE